jgi:hypothetical protein
MQSNADEASQTSSDFEFEFKSEFKRMSLPKTQTDTQPMFAEYFRIWPLTYETRISLQRACQ